MMSKLYGNPTVEIVEQTQSQPIRFRYRCEGHSAGSIMGVNSTDRKKTYPAIRVRNYDGPVAVVVSCVTVDERPKPHPNGIIGKGSKLGSRTVQFTTSAERPHVYSFQNLGIECSRATDVCSSLQQRKKNGIDPFKTGFEHMHTPKLINLHEIRLCFQVYIYTDPSNSKNPIPLPPVLSNIISNKNHTNMKLVVHKVSDQTSPTCGDKEIMIFCDKVDKKDIGIMFYEEDEQRSVVWKEMVELHPKNIHRQVAISFTVPAYKIEKISEPVNVFFRLQTLAANSFSDPVQFQYVPDHNCMEWVANTKKRKLDDSRSLCDYMQDHDTECQPKSKKIRKIKPRRAVRNENIPPDNSNCGASNFLGNSLPTEEPQHFNSFKPQSQHEQPFQHQQQADYQCPSVQPQQKANHRLTSSQHQQGTEYQRPSSQQHQGTEYLWSSSQPLHPLQMCNVDQYPPITQPQHQMDPNRGVYSMTYDAHGGAVASNSNSNYIFDYCGQQSQPIGNSPMPMIYSAGPIGPTLDSSQQIGPEIIQQFCSTTQYSQPIEPNITEMTEILADKNLLEQLCHFLYDTAIDQNVTEVTNVTDGCLNGEPYNTCP